MSAKRYEIRAWSDLFAIPANRRKACFAELEMAMSLYEFAIGDDEIDREPFQSVQRPAADRLR